jgi:hypothetical protein
MRMLSSPDTVSVDMMSVGADLSVSLPVDARIRADKSAPTIISYHPIIS